jgi:hypothetical protein
MSSRKQGFMQRATLVTAAALLLTPLVGFAQSSSSSTKSPTPAPTASADQWLHVRIICSDAKGETVRVNVPLELAEKVLPTINKDRLHDGKVKIDLAHAHNDIDLRALVDAIRTSKDGEFVTVQSKENDVRVAKKDGYLLVHITDKDQDKEHGKEHAKKTQVEVKVPMKVVDALFSAGKDELDVVAALHALGAQGDTELVSVKDEENTIRVWLDSKNVAD